MHEFYFRILLIMPFHPSGFFQIPIFSNQIYSTIKYLVPNNIINSRNARNKHLNLYLVFLYIEGCCLYPRSGLTSLKIGYLVKISGKVQLHNCKYLEYFKDKIPSKMKKYNLMICVTFLATQPICWQQPPSETSLAQSIWRRSCLREKQSATWWSKRWTRPQTRGASK